MNWKALLLKSFIVYAVDMGLAIVGFIYGFGIEIHNVFAVVGLMLVGRFFTTAVATAVIRAEAKKEQFRDSVELSVIDLIVKRRIEQAIIGTVLNKNGDGHEKILEAWRSPPL